MNRPEYLDCPRAAHAGIAWNVCLAGALRDRWRSHEEMRQKCWRRPSPKHIHALRREARKLMALVTLAAAVREVSIKKARRELKRILRVTSDARDSHVQAVALKELLPTHPDLRKFFHYLRRREHHAVAAAQKELHRWEPDLHLTQIIRAAVVPSKNHHAGPAVTQALRKAISELLRTAGAGGGTSEDLHHIRLAVKNVHYLAESMRDALSAGGAAWLRQLHHHQRLLGEIHDLDLLLCRFDRYLGKRKAPLPSVRKHLVQRRARLLKRYRSHRLPRPPAALRVGGHKLARLRHCIRADTKPGTALVTSATVSPAWSPATHQITEEEAVEV